MSILRFNWAVTFSPDSLFQHLIWYFHKLGEIYFRVVGELLSSRNKKSRANLGLIESKSIELLFYLSSSIIRAAWFKAEGRLL